ncbi:unannotated protein [freshwater metagenome]|uniref:Unannotated protein n=1 Tax=freshwater metagenome TaxID=449393 RepID=A0A6J7PX87_9ZZZZ
MRHGRTQVAAPNADVDYGANSSARGTQPGAGADLVAEHGHAVEHLVDLGHHLDTVDDERLAARRPQSNVQYGAVLGDVDAVAAEHGVDAVAHRSALGERD